MCLQSWLISVNDFRQAMKERREEIYIHKEMLEAQYRSANTERQQISAELQERIAKIDKLRKRLVADWHR